MVDPASSQKRRTKGKTYDVRFSGELTADDRAALNRRGFELIENAFSVLAPELGEAPAAFERPRVLGWSETTYQVVRLIAGSPDDARQEVIAALGREPGNLSASPAT